MIGRHVRQTFWTALRGAALTGQTVLPMKRYTPRLQRHSLRYARTTRGSRPLGKAACTRGGAPPIELPMRMCDPIERIALKMTRKACFASSQSPHSSSATMGLAQASLEPLQAAKQACPIDTKPIFLAPPKHRTSTANGRRSTRVQQYQNIMLTRSFIKTEPPPLGTF